MGLLRLFDEQPPPKKKARRGMMTSMFGLCAFWRNDPPLEDDDDESSREAQSDASELVVPETRAPTRKRVRKIGGTAEELPMVIALGSQDRQSDCKNADDGSSVEEKDPIRRYSLRHRVDTEKTTSTAGTSAGEDQVEVSSSSDDESLREPNTTQHLRSSRRVRGVNPLMSGLPDPESVFRGRNPEAASATSIASEIVVRSSPRLRDVSYQSESRSDDLPKHEAKVKPRKDLVRRRASPRLRGEDALSEEDRPLEQPASRTCRRRQADGLLDGASEARPVTRMRRHDRPRSSPRIRGDDPLMDGLPDPASRVRRTYPVVTPATAISSEGTPRSSARLRGSGPSQNEPLSNVMQKHEPMVKPREDLVCRRASPRLSGEGPMSDGLPSLTRRAEHSLQQPASRSRQADPCEMHTSSVVPPVPSADRPRSSPRLRGDNPLMEGLPDPVVRCRNPVVAPTTISSEGAVRSSQRFRGDEPRSSGLPFVTPVARSARSARGRSSDTELNNDQFVDTPRRSLRLADLPVVDDCVHQAGAEYGPALEGDKVVGELCGPTSVAPLTGQQTDDPLEPEGFAVPVPLGSVDGCKTRSLPNYLTGDSLISHYRQLAADGLCENLRLADVRSESAQLSIDRMIASLSSRVADFDGASRDVEAEHALQRRCIPVLRSYERQERFLRDQEANEHTTAATTTANSGADSRLHDVRVRLTVGKAVKKKRKQVSVPLTTTPTPLCRRIDFSVEDHESCGAQTRRRKLEQERGLRTLMVLGEMKHSAAFVREYNEGLLG